MKLISFHKKGRVYMGYFLCYEMSFEVAILGKESCIAGFWLV